ncbi:MAG TPA: acetoin utilization protein AcuC [Mycobacteriales bacterium]|nr:acetoin utilization protein AcuC [Mycobacteriales bacterium]
MSDSVAVVWDDGYLGYKLSEDHPLHPVRLALTVSLARGLGVLGHSSVQMLRPEPASDELLTLVHSAEYLDAVRRAPTDPDVGHGLNTPDNPVFADMHEAAALITGGSVLAARRIWAGESQHALNIAGGLHHAMRAQASGFCVYNDAAIAIAELLRRGADRVAYVDVDVHHGDGVQAAFYDDPRVLTISLHQSPLTLFPGTGFPDEIGDGDAAGMSVNVALPPGTADRGWLRAFHAVVPGLLRAFQPQVLVTQCGCDTHHEDPLANLALTVDGQRASYAALHELAHEFCGGRWLGFGGGGYGLVRCVPRAWTHLIAEATGEPVPAWTRIPAEWQEEVRARGFRITPPVWMTEAGERATLIDPDAGPGAAQDGDADDGRPAYQPWQPGAGTPLDRAIVATRRAVYPLHGLDPDDPRD